MLLIASLTFVVYYTLWIVLLPLLPIDDEHIVRSLFPRNVLHVGLAIPVVLGTIFFASVLLFAVIEIRAQGADAAVELAADVKTKKQQQIRS